MSTLSDPRAADSTNAPKADASQLRRMMLFIWIALFFAPLFLLGVIVFLRAYGGLAPPKPMALVPEVLGVAALLCHGLALLIPSLVDVDAAARRALSGWPVDESQRWTHAVLLHLQHQLRRLLIAWSLTEAGALLAGVALFLCGFVPLLIAAAALFPVAMLVHMPLRSRVDHPLVEFLTEQGLALDAAERLIEPS